MLNISPPRVQYKALTFLTMLYCTIIIAASILIYKLIIIHGLIYSVGAFLIPTWFMLGDVIAEVYGYRESKKVIWLTLACTLIFSLICVLLIKLPSPISWTHQEEYNYVVGSLLRVYIGLFIAVVCGSFLNTYILTKWKTLVKGKYFWLRSISSSWIGHLIFTIVTISIDLYGRIPLHALLKLMAISFPSKIAFLIIAVIPATIAVHFLKKYENIDVYESHIHFNPFVLKQ